jgi:hypothetical protein
VLGLGEAVRSESSRQGAGCCVGAWSAWSAAGVLCEVVLLVVGLPIGHMGLLSVRVGGLGMLAC